MEEIGSQKGNINGCYVTHELRKALKSQTEKRRSQTKWSKKSSCYNVYSVHNKNNILILLRRFLKFQALIFGLL